PGFVWTFERELLRSAHGPVMRTDAGTFAIRYAGMGEIRQPEQWLRMSKAENYRQWHSAMSMQSFASFNFVYADRTGKIAFLHNSLTPVRLPGPDWRGVLPGDDSRLIWHETLDLSALPQVVDPPSGFVLSANQSPFHVSALGSNPVESDYPIEHGFPTRMTNRAYRGLALFEALSPISRSDMRRIKFDNAYSERSRSYRYVASLFGMDFEGRPELQAARDLLIGWDRKTDFDNRAAALAVCILGAEWQAEQAGLEPPPVRGEFERCVAILREKVGRIDPPWREVNRLVHADFDRAIQGGPDVLRAVYGIGLEDEGRLHDVGGDGLFFFVEWDASGTLRVESIHPFGSATSHPDSPHHSDQSPLFVAEKTKDPCFEEDSLWRNLESSYRPQEADR
ncbi:MAG TPA: acylase, partial [Deltaproteobacteria bacterium]|nr:acylase [Deltaproteobacteria bacterium]